MPIPNDVVKTDSFKHLYETVNEALAVLRTYEADIDYKARGNSYFEDFASGWTGTRFKVYWNGFLPSYTSNPPGGRSLVGAYQNQYFDFFSYNIEPPTATGLQTVATFVAEDFGSDAHVMGPVLAPGFGHSDEGEGLIVEIRFRMHATSTNTTYTVGLFGNPAGYEAPLLNPAIEDAAPTHAHFIGMWFSKELTHTNWRKFQRNDSVTLVDAAMTAPIDTSWHTLRIEKILGDGFFTLYFDGVSQGTVLAIDTLYAPYALGFISGGVSHTGFDIDYVKIDHDLNASARP